MLSEHSETPQWITRSLFSVGVGQGIVLGMPLPEAAVWDVHLSGDSLCSPGCTTCNNCKLLWCPTVSGICSFLPPVHLSSSCSWHPPGWTFCKQRSFLGKLQLHLEPILCSLGFYQSSQANRISLHKFPPDYSQEVFYQGGISNRVLPTPSCPSINLRPAHKMKLSFPLILYCTKYNYKQKLSCA